MNFVWRKEIQTVILLSSLIIEAIYSFKYNLINLYTVTFIKHSENIYLQVRIRCSNSHLVITNEFKLLSFCFSTSF